MKTEIETFDFLIFGGAGDLSLRKLLPALYQWERDGALPVDARIIASSRSEMNLDQFLDLARSAFARFHPDETLDPVSWDRFCARFSYVTLDVTGSPGWEPLTRMLDAEPDRVRAFYLATSPELYGPICQGLQRNKLVTPESRVVLEKPIGHDLASAHRINELIASVFEESQTFRIDHYLGKEAVQNLMVLRFGNSLFEPRWSNVWIDHVQITVSESIGTAGRGDYYDGAGALRDMVQNHLLQLLCLVCMEPPQTLDKESIRDEKIKVLQALKPIDRDSVARHTVRGQYAQGAVGGQTVPGYRNEPGISEHSSTETFVALKAQVQNWRWAGVPFYLRTGKRLQEQRSEVVVQFKAVAHNIFARESGELAPNQLVIRLQPDESVSLNLMTKEPGPGGIRLRDADLNLSYAQTFKRRMPDAYERLLMDVIRANSTLFMRRDEIEAAWNWIDGVHEAWAERGGSPKAYPAGSWGPSSAIALIERDGRTWHEDQ